MSPLATLRSTALAALLTLGAVAPAAAVCTYNVLGQDVTVTPGATPTYYQFTQTNPYWTAVAVRPPAGEDWDMITYSATAPDPTCLSGPLASSAYGSGVADFVIGDFNHDPAGTYYVETHRYSGVGFPSVQWDDGPDLVGVNGPALTQALASTDIIRVYDVALISGTTYNFDFFPTSGSGFHMLLFRNPAAGTFWTGRAGAEFEVAGSTAYTAPSTAFYGVVVVNDNAATGSYVLGVSNTCSVPFTLAGNVPYNVAPNEFHSAFESKVWYWEGVATEAVTGDWDLSLDGSPTGSAAPVCVSGPLASSGYGAGAVDITVGDFNLSPHGWYFPRSYMFSGGGTAQVQSVVTGGVISTNGPPSTGSFAAGELARIYDVAMYAGHTYNIELNAAPGENLLLFANVGGGSYFAGRVSAVLTTSGFATYVAPVTAFYGVAVVNDSQAAGTYSVVIGDCGDVRTLTSDVPVLLGPQHDYYSFDQADFYWTAIGVRNLGSDWDITVNQDNVASPWPGCATIPLASSGLLPPKMDFVVGDFNHNPLGTYYAHARQFTAPPITSGRVEWDSGTDLIFPNDNNPTTRATGVNDLLGCWDVLLTAGQTYEFDLFHGGGADLKLLLFRNPTGGIYWAGRSGAQFEVATTQTYTPPTSGYYGVVVVNDNGVADSYAINVKTCDPIVALAPAPAITGTSAGVSLWSFTQSQRFWTPVAIRANNIAEDFDIESFSAPAGGPIGLCLSGPLSSSGFGAGVTDFVIGDFNFDPFGTYYAYGHRFAGAGSTQIQFYPGHQLLNVGGPDQFRTAAAASLLVESWDVLLTAGHAYGLLFTHAPSLDAKVCLFTPTGGVYWTGRPFATRESDRSFDFTAGIGGWYGVVVVRDGGFGTFDLGIYNGGVAVNGSAPPERDALNGVSPNPGRGGLHFDYALHDGADVSFEVLDMAGRIVSRLEPGEKGPGSWSESWTSNDGGGRPLPAGLYFVRLRAGSRTIGMRKLTLLE